MQLLKTRRGQAIVGLILGALTIGGVAFAASFVFANFGGNTGFTDTSAGGKITAVSGTKGETGVDCTSARANGDTGFTVDPKAPRVKRGLEDAKVTAGSCVVTLTIQNTGTEPLRPGVATSQKPAGWTFEASERGKVFSIAAGASGRLDVVITAGENATAGGIAGTLTSDDGTGTTPGKAATDDEKAAT